MRKRRRIVAGVVVLGVIGFYLILSRDPLIEGSRLSYWIVASQSKNDKEGEQARRVIGRLGTNEVPLLLKWLAKKPNHSPGLNDRINDTYQNLCVWLVGKGVLRRPPAEKLINHPPPPDAFTLASWALPLLGHDARVCAVPTLAGRLSDNRQWVWDGAWQALQQMSPESVAPLSECLSNRDYTARGLAAAALGNIGVAGGPAIPVLEEALKDDSGWVRISAAQSLGKLGDDPRNFMPVVIESLREPDLLDSKLELLGKYTNDAKVAVPMLVGMLERTADTNTPPDWVMDSLVLATLRRVDPAAAARFEPVPVVTNGFAGRVVRGF